MEREDLNLILPLVDAALAEDMGSGDVTTLATVDAGTEATAEIRAEAEGIICGLTVARVVFLRLDPGLTFEIDVEEGSRVRPGDRVARIRGSARSILTAERTALNFLQYMSGIATATARGVKELEGTRTRLLDTRKTIPGTRYLAKYAVRCGGGTNHRMGLHDMMLIKENHIAAAGGIPSAVARARRAHPDLSLEVEVTGLEELEEALTAGVDRVLLDNFTRADLRRALDRLRSAAGETGGPLPEVELSGGITPQTLKEHALEGVDFISSGALTHSVRSLDLSLDLELAGGPDPGDG